MTVKEDWQMPELELTLYSRMPITVNCIEKHDLIYLVQGFETGMTTIEASVLIDATPKIVWGIISDLDNEPKYWKGTKEVRNIEKKGNRIIREITIAFRDQKCIQDVELIPEKQIVAKFTEGIIKGSKTINIFPSENKTKLEAVWDIKLSGMMGMFTSMISKHIKNGTEMALNSIKESAEH